MRRLIFFLIAIFAFAQDEAVFRATTQLVRIDVVAQDKNGNVVPDLTKEDFDLKVAGKPQTIATFTVTTSEPATSVTLPRGAFTNKQAATEVAQGRYTVFLLDWRNTNWQLQTWSRQELLKMVDATPPKGEVALYLLKDNGFQISQEFTSNPELIKARVAALSGEIPAPTGGAATETILDFIAIAKHLSGISGQKVLIWVSTGVAGDSPRVPPGPGAGPVLVASSNAPSPDIDSIVHVLGNANIVVEATESTYLFAHVSPDTGPTSTYPNTLSAIAERTGGRFFPAETNDFASTLSAAASDRSTSYELGYYAADDLQPGLQPFEIRCRRPGVTLRYREGYYIEKKPPAIQTDIRAASQEIMEGAVDAVAIPLTAAAGRTAGNAGSIILRLNVDANALTLRHDGDTWRTRISASARFASDVEDQLGSIPLDSPALNLTEAQHEKALRTGINLRFTMKIPPGAASLRVLVRDDDSGNTGTVTIPLDDLPEM